MRTMQYEFINPYKLFIGSFVPNWVLRRSEISAGAKLTYARLAQYAGQSGECYPAQQTLARELGVSEKTARGYIQELETVELIVSVRRGLGRSNVYKFVKHDWMEFRTTVPERNTPTVLQRNTPTVPERNTPTVKESKDKEDPEKENPVEENRSVGPKAPGEEGAKAQQATSSQQSQTSKANDNDQELENWSDFLGLAPTGQEQKREQSLVGNSERSERRCTRRNNKPYSELTDKELNSLFQRTCKSVTSFVGFYPFKANVDSEYCQTARKAFPTRQAFIEAVVKYAGGLPVNAHATVRHFLTVTGNGKSESKAQRGAAAYLQIAKLIGKPPTGMNDNWYEMVADAVGLIPVDQLALEYKRRFPKCSQVEFYHITDIAKELAQVNPASAVVAG